MLCNSLNIAESKVHTFESVIDDWGAIFSVVTADWIDCRGASPTALHL